MAKVIVVPMISISPQGAFSRHVLESLERLQCWRILRRSQRQKSNFAKRVRPSKPSPRTTLELRARIPTSSFSTNCGHTPAKVRVGFGMKWCQFRLEKYLHD